MKKMLKEETKGKKLNEIWKVEKDTMKKADRTYGKSNFKVFQIVFFTSSRKTEKLNFL